MNRNRELTITAVCIFLGLCFFLAAFLVNMAGKPETPEMTQTEPVTNQTTEPTETDSMAESVTESETTPVLPQTESETEPVSEKIKPVVFHIDSLASFLTEEGIEDVKRQVTELLPETDRILTVKLMTYQEVSADGKTVLFYLCDSEDNVYGGVYDFSGHTVKIAASKETKDTIQKKEIDRIARIAESERQAQEEAVKRLESERAAESEKAAQSEKETEKPKNKKDKKDKNTKAE